ncbi:hypothetical protein QR680_017086 [Steinernema hermaphroditum]|uniref:Uncharacterized protein n=1 Tax=Steinernema hermaphroditum TaxID=289476 RepID=A0AA39HD92_9BILA|nr:hypothetical protein QR680_017086 [Steinernema hermaphroditum]
MAEILTAQNSPFTSKHSKVSFPSQHIVENGVTMKGILLVSLFVILLCADAQWWGYGYYPYYGMGWYDPWMYGGWYGKKKRDVERKEAPIPHHPLRGIPGATP